MKPLFLDNLLNLLNIDFIFLNKILLLAFVFLFFAAVLVLHRSVSRNIPLSKVSATIKLSVFGILILALRWGLGATSAYARTADTIGSIVVMLCLANLAAYAIIDIYIVRKTRSRFPSFSRDLVTLVIYLVFGIVSLRVIFHIDVTSILTTTTVLTAAVAFAMQSTLASIASGFSIQNENQFRQGTWISIKEKDVVGEIVNVGFRYTTLRTLDAHNVLIPNTMLLQNIVVNYGNVNHKDMTPVVLSVGLGYEVPPDRGKQMLLRVLRAERGIALAPPPAVEVRSFQPSSIDYVLRFFIDDFSERNLVADGVLRHVWYAVRREGHDFPYQRLELFPAPSVSDVALGRDAVLSGLKDADIFKSFSDEEYDRLADRAASRLYGSGETVVGQGDDGESLFIVKRGSLRVFVDGAEVGRLKEGNVFGEMSLLTGEKRSASVVADDESSLIEVRKEHLEPILRRDAGLLDALSALLVQRQEANIDHRKRLELAEAGVRKNAFLQKLKSFFGL